MTDDIIPYPREKLIDIIDDIVYNENRKIVSIFKDYLIYDDIGDFLSRMYTIPEVKPRLNRQSYEQNSKMLNNTNNKSDIYDLDVFRNPYNKDGTNSFENLVKEFVENYTDLDLSEEIIKRPRDDRKSNYNNIKVSENSYLDFDSSISIIQKHQEKTLSK